MANVVIEKMEKEGDTPMRKKTEKEREKGKAAKTPKPVILDENGNDLAKPQCIKDLEMIFTTYSQECHPKPANQNKCKSISEKVTQSAKRRGSTGLPIPVIRYQDVHQRIPTHSSYDEALTFYELKMDSYLSRDPVPLESVLALEVWFIQIMEPPPQQIERMDGWRAREMFKTEQGFTKHLPQSLQLPMFNRVLPLLPTGWVEEHLRLVKYAELTCPTVVIVAPEGKTKLPGAPTGTKVMANISKFKRGTKK